MRKLYSIVAAGALLASSPSFATIDLATFQELAYRNVDRCMPVSVEECGLYFDVALEKNLITKEAHLWGVKEGFCPVINLWYEVGVVCPLAEE